MLRIAGFPLPRVISRQVESPVGSEITANEERLELIRFNPKRINSSDLAASAAEDRVRS